MHDLWRIWLDFAGSSAMVVVGNGDFLALDWGIGVSDVLKTGFCDLGVNFPVES